MLGTLKISKPVIAHCVLPDLNRWHKLVTGIMTGAQKTKKLVDFHSQKMGWSLKNQPVQSTELIF